MLLNFQIKNIQISHRESYKNVLFLYISDDLDWGIKNLRSRTASAGDLYFVGDGMVNNQDR